ncbi:hypothetical protein POM88_040029 [Heracleum sosnowskyi]|uniref:Uncharacterized protein n=1 Tax=Heracleum sosnowskyi TaxID=360622 RepID=A0AAD8HDY7_9APIA|nr:hypothetical protein POM88_040029 [Heracleum sosnowskyi]
MRAQDPQISLDEMNTLLDTQFKKWMLNKERYVELCEKEKVDPNNASISIWAKVVGVQKNSIIGVPRTKASDIIPIERSRKKRRRHNDDESCASTNGRLYHMSDDCVIQAVDQTVAYARRHPEDFGLTPEQVLTLEKSVSVTEGDDELPANHPLGMGTMTELVRVMVMVLTDIQARQEPNNKNGKGKYVMCEDDLSSSDGDDVCHPSHSPPPK